MDRPDPGKPAFASGLKEAMSRVKSPDGSIVTVTYNSEGSTTTHAVDTALQFDMPGNGWAIVDWQPD